MMVRVKESYNAPLAALTSVVPVGRVSVTTAPVTVLQPEFDTVIV